MLRERGAVVRVASTFLLVTPLPDWRGSAQDVAEGIAIRRLTAEERAVVDVSDALLLHHEIEQAERGGWWLCYQFLNEHPVENVRHRRRQDAAFKLMLHAIYAVQILVPIGASNLVLLYGRTEDGLALVTVQHRQRYLGTQWARMCDVPASFGADVPLLVERVHAAFQKPVLRLQIPVWLLEQGLLASDRHIRILLWATGLDGVMRAGGVAAFGERLCSLLGAPSPVFPSAGPVRPACTVQDVAEDLYLLRTEMAHGLPFHERFRKQRAFVEAAGFEGLAILRYDHLLEECAGFLLCRALREILLRNLAFDTQAKCWAVQG